VSASGVIFPIRFVLSSAISGVARRYSAAPSLNSFVPVETKYLMCGANPVNPSHAVPPPHQRDRFAFPMNNGEGFLRFAIKKMARETHELIDVVGTPSSGGFSEPYTHRGPIESLPATVSFSPTSLIVISSIAIPLQNLGTPIILSPIYFCIST